jgi:hypothetical protein
MFWKRKRRLDKLRFQHYVALRLSTSISAVLEKKASSEKYREIYKDFMQLLASETFVMACMIGACRPDIITGIFRQNDEDYEQLMEVTRDQVTNITAAREQKGELNLNDLASLFTKSVIDIMPEDGLSKDLTIEEINSLGGTVLFGYTFGHGHPQRFLEMLEKRLQEANKIGPNTFFIAGMLSIYGPLLEEVDRSFLSSTDEFDGIRLAYKNGTLPKKLTYIYQNIASGLVSDYESAVGPLK